MTVYELIRELANYGPDEEVEVWGVDERATHEIVEVRRRQIRHGVAGPEPVQLKTLKQGES